MGLSEQARWPLEDRPMSGGPVGQHLSTMQLRPESSQVSRHETIDNKIAYIRASARL